jgi:hypothetical protein
MKRKGFDPLQFRVWLEIDSMKGTTALETFTGNGLDRCRDLD